MPFAINPPGDAHEFEAEKCRLGGTNSAQGTSKTKIVLSFPIAFRYSEYQSTGDQPQAIEKLVKGFKEGNQCQTLPGVTGSDKTFTMANVIK